MILGKAACGLAQPRGLGGRASAERVGRLLRKAQKQQVAGFSLPQAWGAVSGGISSVVPVLPSSWRWLTADPSGAILWPGLAWPSQELVCVRGVGGRGRRSRPPSQLRP